MANDKIKEVVAPEVKEEEAVVEQNIIDLDLGAIEKKRIRINGDNTKIIYINPSDLNIFARFNEAYPKLKELEEEMTTLGLESEDPTEEEMSAFVESLKSIDQKMREYVNFIFDTDVCTACADGGSMYDPFDGKMRYEHILEALSGLYESNFTSEIKKMRARVSKYTSKYHK